MGPSEFADAANVSHETVKKIEIYAAQLARWNARINLVARSTLPNMWERHFLDSAQLLPLLPSEPRILCDLGSGAGFPGLVLAALSNHTVTLVESDQRKSVFLRETARAMGVTVQVRSERIESVEDIQADIVTARALASIDLLLGYSEKILKPEGICLFLKGNRLGAELTEANKLWHIESQTHSSRTDADSAILQVNGFRRKG